MRSTEYVSIVYPYTESKENEIILKNSANNKNNDNVEILIMIIIVIIILILLLLIIIKL